MNDTSKWACIFKTNKLFEAEVIKTALEHSGIRCVIINKQDSSYLAFGIIELHVPEPQQAEALAWIKEQAKTEEL